MADCAKKTELFGNFENLLHTRYANPDFRHFERVVMLA